MAGTASARRPRAPLILWAACLLYCALLPVGWAVLHVLPIQLMAIPVLLAATMEGQRAATWVVTGLTLFSLVLNALLADAAPLAALVGLVLPIPVIGAGLGYAKDRYEARTREARDQSERYELAARSVGDGLFDWRLRDDCVHYSETFARLLGYAPEELGTTPDEWFARVHPDDLPGLRSAIDAHVAGSAPHLESEHRVRRKDGSWRWVVAHGMAARAPDGTVERIAGWYTDIQERKSSEDELRHHAFHDALTALPNRALFMDRLIHALARARRNPTHHFAVILLDLDRFKQINDTLGHQAGDELLVTVAQRLESCLRPGDTVARLGGDEFMLLLEDVSGPDDARSVAERTQRALALPLTLSGHEVTATASIGIAVGDGSVRDAQDLLRDADTAMYEAKSQGPGRLVSFDARMHDRAVERLELENALRSAIARDELSVVYQPIYELESRTIVGFEALARWRHPSLGAVAPVRFIALAEETGLISDIGAWVLTQAAKQARRLELLFPGRTLAMHVNTSVRQLQQDRVLLDHVERALTTSGLGPERLTIEITESILMEEAEKGERLLSALRARGIRVCMDDFGTGYSSLSYLHRARVDSLKIDVSFVRDLSDTNGRGEVVRTILTLARALGLSVVAEGIETRDQLSRLLALGCRRGQGYLFSKPVDGPATEALLRKSAS